MVKKDRKFYRDYISDLIRKGAVKAALSWIAKKMAFLTTGPLGWLTTLVLEQAWDYFGDKMVKWALRKGALVIDKTDGYIKAKKIKDARESDGTSYDDSVDDVFR